jgi:hypothetical protein
MTWYGSPVARPNNHTLLCLSPRAVPGCGLIPEPSTDVLRSPVQNERRRLSKKKSHDAAQESIRARIRAQPSDSYPDGICGICFQALNTFGIDDAIVCSCCSITVHQVRSCMRPAQLLF